MNPKYSFGGLRGAIVIGINEYPNLPQDKQLQGAVNDAEELSEKLRTYGNFNDIRCLTNKNAKFEHIRTAINDIFFKEDAYEQVVFYFAGHGVEDGFGTAYIAPSDFLPTAPYVWGIPMEEIKRIFQNYYSSSTALKKGVCVFLDCCYGGRFIESGGRAIESKSTGFGNRARNTLKTGGIVALASMDVDERSRENPRFTHLTNNNPHSHGIFTSYLIEGLEGKATSAGIVTFNGLANYMKDKMEMAAERQQLQELTIGDAGIADLEIAMAPGEVLSVYIPKLIAECKTFSEKNIFSVKYAAEKIKELDKYEGFESDASECKELITKHLIGQRQKIWDWVYANVTKKKEYRDQIEGMRNGTLYDILSRLAGEKLGSYERFVDIDDFRLCLVDILYGFVNEPDPIKSTDLRAFIFGCQSCINSHST